ncbi:MULTISPECIES: UxaA family hydrolase [unclassified Solibacillus]|uniref:UxaA family hydrolase n=1 Tax=unclassified Solibacillus TaxID=2637870 RepID=UPI0030F727ED
MKYIVLSERDNVATALENIPIDTEVQIPTKNNLIKLKQEIQFGHKFALEDILKGDRIIKYGETIGVATCNILKGFHVHVHNLEGTRGRGDKVD